MRKLLFLLIVSILFFPTVALSGQTSITSSGYYCSSDSFSSGNNNYTCSAGTIFPSGSGELCTYNQTPCVQQTSTPQCQNGYTYNSSTGQCTETTTSTSIVSASCPSGYSWNGSTCSKTSTVVYSAGSTCAPEYVQCKRGTKVITGETTRNSDCLTNNDSDKPEYYYECVGSTYYTSSPICPSGYTYIGNYQCSGTTTSTSTASPTCPSGTTLINGECVSYSCPLGGSTQCIEPSSGSSTYYCSPETCQYLTYNNGTITISGSASTSGSLPQAPPNNGTVTSAGCQGSIYIFSGTAVSCRSGGLQTAYHDCCNAGTYLFGAVQCNSTEKVTAQSLTYDQQYGNSVYPNANYTGGLEGEDIYVGSYCSDSFLGMCLETMDVFCQFPGLLAATIQQQGRAQLGTGWGSAKNPDCSGFTPNQFQELNFGNMNLSNYTNVLEQTTINGLSGTVNNNIGNIENSITNEINQSMSGQ